MNWDDKEVVLAAVKANGYAIEDASPRLRDDREVVLEALGSRGYALHYASKRLQDDREVVLAATRNRVLVHTASGMFDMKATSKWMCEGHSRDDYIPVQIDNP